MIFVLVVEAIIKSQVAQQSPTPPNIYIQPDSLSTLLMLLDYKTYLQVIFKRRLLSPC